MSEHLGEPVATDVEWLARRTENAYKAGYDTGYMVASVKAHEIKQEPVAWRWMPTPYWKQWIYSDDGERVEEAKRFMGDGGVQPLYTTPPQGEARGLSQQPAQKPLTDEAIATVYWGATGQSLRPQDNVLAHKFAKAIEAAHGIKENT